MAKPPAPKAAVAPRPAPAAPPAAPPPKPTVESAHGRFCWYDLMVHDVESAVRFYTSLFGWGTHTMDMGPAGPYHMFSAGGIDFAGVARLPQAELPPHWSGYVGVPNVVAACAAAQASGGKVLVPPTTIPGVGSFAVIADPTGGSVQPIQLAGPPMRDLNAPPLPGMVAWDELVTPEPAAAAPFYSRVFGWTLGQMPMPDGSYYGLFRKGGNDEAGLLKTPPGVPPGPGRWMFYFLVTDIEATAKKAVALGARVLMAPWTVPTVGRLAILADPGGAVFALFLPSRK